jgi:hypothetical protein
MTDTSYSTEVLSKHGPAHIYDKILKWDLTYLKDYMVASEIIQADLADKLEREYKRFIYLLTITGHRGVPISEQVDKMWHNHILFTRDYVAFCDSVIGRYIHHLPMLDNGSSSLLEDLHANTLTLYQRCFGNFDNTFWSVNKVKCQDCMGDYDDNDEPGEE